MLREAQPIEVPGSTHRPERTKLVAAIPAFNEERNLEGVISSARKFVDEVIVVDDGSNDGTASVAERSGAHVLRHPVNQGYGAAIRTCLSYARNNGTKILVTLDGDGQHRPEQIPSVVAPVASGQADISIGSRFLEEDSRLRVPRYRRFGIAVLTRLTNLRTRYEARITDGQSGFRAYSRKAIETIDPRDPDMGASAEILISAHRSGLRVAEVPIQVDYSIHVPTRNPSLHGLTVLASIIRSLEEDHRLSFATFVGLLTFSLGAATSAMLWAEYGRILSLPGPGPVIGLSLATVGSLTGFAGWIHQRVRRQTTSPPPG